jgi:hypothetical protein
MSDAYSGSGLSLLNAETHQSDAPCQMLVMMNVIAGLMLNVVVVETWGSQPQKADGVIDVVNGEIDAAGSVPAATTTMAVAAGSRAQSGRVRVHFVTLVREEVGGRRIEEKDGSWRRMRCGLIAMDAAGC